MVVPLVIIIKLLTQGNVLLAVMNFAHQIIFATNA